MIKRILVGLGDRSFSSVATQQAVELAQQHDAELTAVTVVDINRLFYTGPVPLGAMYAAEHLAESRLAQTREVVEASVEEFKETCRTAGVVHQVIFEEREPFDLMISCSRYHDLMIFGLRTLFEHGVVEEPHHELATLVSAGVRPIYAVANTFRPIRRVLVAYSGSMESAKTMKRFVQLRLWPDAKLRIVTFNQTRERADRLLESAASYCRAHGFDPETDAPEGSPKNQLLSYAAQWDADLIVLGNSAKSLMRRKVFGETALNAIRDSDRPLFLCQ